jgi:hypothetical protein
MPEHRAVLETRLLAEELEQTRALVEFLLGHFKRLVDAAACSPDRNTRDVALQYRTVAMQRVQQGPEWCWALLVARPIEALPADQLAAGRRNTP